MSPTVRADVVRNRAKILAVARECFEEQGLDASLDGIAKRAGVGPGTLYRHFPGRDELVAAVLEDEMIDLEREFTDLQNSRLDAEAKLTRWTEALHRWMTRYAGLPDPLRAALNSGVGCLSVRCQAAIDWTDQLVAEGRRAGVVKDFVTGRELYRATLGLAWVAASTGIAAEDAADPLHHLLGHGWRRDD
ncbi:helix-turn-helix domain-containing protein [Streptomyces sp. NPDC047973]|uniref:TetR/AcrR family transcriptional regulator n=1 Tax=Streptomyces sp. NPDC047973 TaxID=3155383 RepID=UPI003434BB92